MVIGARDLADYLEAQGFPVTRLQVAEASDAPLDGAVVCVNAIQLRSARLLYIQLQRSFAWEAYQRVFAEYRDLPARQRPRTDAEKRDQWLVRMSRTVEHNLDPFFETWGVPTSAAARQSIEDLPVWMPEGFPPTC